MFEYNYNSVKNSTLAKLTKGEIEDLGLVNHGVGLYRGDLKTRYNGMKRQSEDGITFWFEDEAARIEFTEIVSTDPEGRREWATRIYNKRLERYETWPLGIVGCYYIR